MNLESVLANFVPEGLGGGDDDPDIKEKLLAALENHCDTRRKQNLLIIVVAVILLAIVIATLTYDLIVGKNQYLALMGAAGLGIPTLMTPLIAGMGDLSKTVLILRIAKVSDEAEIRSLIEKTLAK